MKKLILLLLLVPLVSFGQLSLDQQKKVFFDDVNLINNKYITLEKVIDYYTEMGLEQVRFNETNSVFMQMENDNILTVFTYTFLSSPNTHYFNAYSTGSVTKILIFKSKDFNTTDNLIEIKTNIVIDEMEGMGDGDMFSKKYKQLKSDFIDVFNENSYIKVEESKSYDFVEPFLKRRYNSIENYVFSNSNNSLIYRFAIGKDSKGKFDKTIHYTTYFKSAAVDANNKLSIKLKEKEKNFIIGAVDLRKINNYDLKAMIGYFLEDAKRNNIAFKPDQNIKAIFEPLEGSTIALAYGSGDDSNILIKVDPEKWATSSEEKRWYILYHELGHDVLNLDHGEGGKMMFNFADRDYSWDEFINDKNYMFNNKNVVLSDNQLPIVTKNYNDSSKTNEYSPQITNNENEVFNKLIDKNFILSLNSSSNGSSKLFNNEYYEHKDALLYGDSQLNGLFKAYGTEIDTSMDEYNTKLQTYSEDAPNQYEETNLAREKELEEMEKEIRDYQQVAKEDIEKQTEKILMPILDKLTPFIEIIQDEREKINNYMNEFPNGNYFSAVSKYYDLIKTELTDLYSTMGEWGYGEIKNITTNDLEINKEDAIEELKKLKELLDLELITQEEFDKKSKELKKIILGN